MLAGALLQAANRHAQALGAIQLPGQRLLLFYGLAAGLGLAIALMACGALKPRKKASSYGH